MPIIKGLAEFLPAHFISHTRNMPLRIVTAGAPVADSDKLLLKVRATIAASVQAAGRHGLQDLGLMRLSRPQAWIGGHMLAPTLPLRSTLTTIGGVRLVVPSSPSPVVGVHDFVVLGDEIVFDADLAAMINVPGVVVFAAHKITVRPGAKITWCPVGFNPQAFDQPGNGRNGTVGAPGRGGTWTNSPHPPSKQGGKGENGAPGASGFDGADAPSVVLIGASIDRLPIMDLAGHRGGNGGRGGNSGPGGPGDKGEPAQCSWGIRKKGRGYGGDGGPGGDAGPGGHGGKGGAGGHVMVYCTQDNLSRFTNVPLEVHLQPGAGGDGGPCGVPGPGGPGGPQGDNCGIGDDTNGRNGVAGPYGRPDHTPPAQLRGPDGEQHGTLQFVPVPEPQLLSILLEPAITNLAPLSATPDTAVTLTCVNLPDATPQVKLSIGPDQRLVVPRRAGNVLSFNIPGDIRGGEYQVALIDPRGAALSTIAVATLTVVPLLTQVNGAGRWGTTLTLAGKGFSREDRVFVGAQSYTPEYDNPTTLHLTLPMPGGAFEQPPETRPVVVADAKGRRSNAMPLTFEHWLHLGFQPINNAFAFQNAKTTLAAAKVDINPDLFRETFGQDDFAVLKPEDLLSVLGDTMNPLRTAAGWTFFAAYKAFLESRPGICCAMSAYALDYFLSRTTPPLHDAFAALQGPIARRLFALQGRVMSKEQIGMGIDAIAKGDGSNERFLDALITNLRHIVDGRDPNARREFPLLSFLPKVTANIKAFAEALPKGHVIIPYAVRFPSPGEHFLYRVYCCNNYQRNVIRVEFTRQGSAVVFTTAMIANDVNMTGWADACYETNAPYGAWSSGDAYSTTGGWLCLPLPMRLALYDDVDMPVDWIEAIIGMFVELKLLV